MEAKKSPMKAILQMKVTDINARIQLKKTIKTIKLERKMRRSQRHERGLETAAVVKEAEAGIIRKGIDPPVEEEKGIKEANWLKRKRMHQRKIL